MLPSFGNSKGHKESSLTAELSALRIFWVALWLTLIVFSFTKVAINATHINCLQFQKVYSHFMQLFNPVLNKTKWIK